MITKCSSQEQNTILSYIGSDYPSCLYLYLDLIKYGADSEKIDLFVQKEGKNVTCAMLKYYSCLHLYSKDNLFNANEIAKFVEQGSFTMLYCTKQIAEKVFASFSLPLSDKSSLTVGWVAQIKGIDKTPQKLAQLAQDKDFDQIVRLIYEDDDIGKSYRFDELALQLKERNEEGYARNYVIKQNDIVIAHACTNAEIGSIAIVAELLVRKEYRRKGYASEIWRDICGKLLDEDKEVYSFYYSDESRALHRKVGFVEICEWGKIVIN